MKATIRTPEAEGLATRMANHFGHKVPVERRDGVVHVETRLGRFELEPRGETLEARVHPTTDDERAQLQQVVSDHLERFARTPIEVEWD